VNLFQTFPLAARALLRNKTRSFLTSLGVIIGVASVISMVAIGEGAKSTVEKVFSAMGTNLLIVTSGTTTSGGVMGGVGSMPTLTWDDLKAIRTEVPAVRLAAPIQSTKTSVVAEDANWTTQVSGTSPEYFDIRAWRIGHGALFFDSEMESVSKVVGLGETVAKRLFGPTEAVGKTVRIRGVPFLVIGVLERKGQSPMGQDYDDVALMPITAFQTKIQGGLQKFIAGVIFVGARADAGTTRAEHEITVLMRDRHRLAPGGGEDDFNIRDLTELAAAQQQGTNTLTGLLAAIAVVSLIVGGIGIMNIMLVSVTERTREIGVRMAVGAKPWHILAQFLVESVTLSLMGGLVGVTVGTGVAAALAQRLGWTLVMRPDIIAVSVGFSALVGIGFGLYPARKSGEARAHRCPPLRMSGRRPRRVGGART
jgi:putative ABC transport system permease protein